jgi:glycosyltransferase involved in cell wall biosynthesis
VKVAFVSVQTRSGHFRTYVDHLLSSGHDVVVLTNTSEPDLPVRVIDLRSGAPGSWLRLRGVGAAARVWRLGRALRTERPDVLDVMPVTPDGLFAALLWRGPLVLDFWGSDLHGLAARPWWVRLLMTRVVRRADRIHSVSGHMTRVLVAKGADAARIETFQYGVDLVEFEFGGAPRATEEILGSRGLRAFYRVETIIRAMPRVLLSRPRAQLLLTKADGPLDSLRSLAVDLGVEGSVTFLGLVPRDDLAARLRRAAVWVSIPPSDGMPLSLLEAMASGAVPVVSDLDTMREWLDESRAVFVDVSSPERVADAILHGLTMAEDGAYAEPNRRAVEQRGDRRTNLPRWERMLTETAARASRARGAPEHGAVGTARRSRGR